MERIRLVMVDDSLLIMVGCPDPKGRGGVKLLDGGWGGNRPQVSCPPRPSLALTCINHMEFCARPREIARTSARERWNTVPLPPPVCPVPTVSAGLRARKNPQQALAFARKPPDCDVLAETQ